MQSDCFDVHYSAKLNGYIRIGGLDATIGFAILLYSRLRLSVTWHPPASYTLGVVVPPRRDAMCEAQTTSQQPQRSGIDRRQENFVHDRKKHPSSRRSSSIAGQTHFRL